MSYLGRGLDKISNIEILDNITFDGSSSYSITKSSVAFVPNSAQSLLISIDGVVQATNFSVSTSTIDFGVAIPSTSTCDFFLHYGTGVLFTPADGTVSLDKLSATGTKDATTFLRGDNTFASAGLSGWSEDGANNNLLPASASAGIYLGTTTATASNLLDDYEEGTWTPAYTGSTTTGTGVTGAGQYTKIGNLVHVDFGFVNVTTSGAAGDLRITGLPFTVSNATTRGSFAGNVRFYNHDLAGNTYYQLTPVADGNTTYIVITQTRDDGTWSVVQIENSAGLYIEGGITYTTTA